MSSYASSTAEIGYKKTFLAQNRTLGTSLFAADHGLSHIHHSGSGLSPWFEGSNSPRTQHFTLFLVLEFWQNQTPIDLPRQKYGLKITFSAILGVQKIVPTLHRRALVEGHQKWHCVFNYSVYLSFPGPYGTKIKRMLQILSQFRLSSFHLCFLFFSFTIV